MSRVTSLLATTAVLGVCTLSGCSKGGGSSVVVVNLPSLEGLSVGSVVTGDARVSPATIRLIAAHPESTPVTVRLSFIHPANPTAELPLSAVTANPLQLETSPNGVEHEITWNFSAEPTLPDDGSLVEGIQLFARFDSGDGISATLTLGNDAPVATVGAPNVAATDGIVSIPVTISDSSNDLTRLRVEYRDLDTAQATWQPARPAGIRRGSATPEFALEGVSATRDGTAVTFEWDSNHDFTNLDRTVAIRITPDDTVASGAPVETSAFAIDNNEEPVVEIDTTTFETVSDERRGIPILYTVLDQERDPSRVVFQWKRDTDSSFPPLDTADPAEILTNIEDPSWRRDRRVCTWFPTYARGHATVVDSTTVRVPELVGDQSFASRSLTGRPIEFMRSSNAFVPMSDAWPFSALNGPAATAPIGDGSSLLVLDSGIGGARLLEIDSETGSVLRTVASGMTGQPTAMDLTLDRESVIIATSLGASWRLLEVEIATGAVDVLMGFVGSPLVDIAALGSHAALAIGGTTLWQVDWSKATASLTALVSNLSDPQGLALDRRRRDRVWIAERTAQVQHGLGRIVTVDLTARTPREIAVEDREFSVSAFPFVSALEFDPSKNRLLALCNPQGDTLEVAQVTLGRSYNEVTVLGRVDANAASIAVHPDGACIVSAPGAGELFASGGVAARRSITSFDAASSSVHLDRSWSPGIELVTHCRIPVRRGFLDTVMPSTNGNREVFVWDSADVDGGGRVQVRATTFDAQLGGSMASGARELKAFGTYETLPILLTATHGDAFMTRADLDEDGALDLIVTGSTDTDVRVFFKNATRGFETEPLVLSAPSADHMSRVVVADLEGDGAEDLISGEAIFFQTGPGLFDIPPLILEGLGAVDVADLDHDGDLDIVSAQDDRLRFWHQTGYRSFSLDVTILNAPNGASLGVPQLVDLDSDGDLDITVGDTTASNLFVFFQLGIGEFDPNPLVLDAPPGAIKATDLDGDGDNDIITDDGTVLSRFEQTAAGTFVAATPLPGVSAPIDAVDVDFDGRLDIVGGGGQTLRQIDGDQFTIIPTFANVSSSNGVADDFDGDGRLDFAGVSQSPHRITVQFERFSLEANASVTPTADSPDSIELADIDGDGILDVVVAAGDPAIVHVMLGRGNGTLNSTPSTLGGATTAEGVVAIQACDLDGNGWVDIVTANTTQQNATIFLQTTNGFSATPIALGGSATTLNPRDVIVADLDADTDPDILVVSDQGLTLFTQSAPGVFDAVGSLLDDSDDHEFVSAVDFDGDGDTDLVTSDHRGEQLRAYCQDSAGDFHACSLGINAVASTFIGFMLVEDIDDDGMLEILTADAFGTQLFIYEQEGPAQFAASPTVLGDPDTLRFPISATMIDIDHDGDKDLAMSDALGLSVFIQVAPGSFDPAAMRITTNSNYLRSLRAADLDNDGDTDVIGAAPSNLRTLWGGR